MTKVKEMTKAKETKATTYVKKDLVNLLHGISEVENLKGVHFAVAVKENQTRITELLKDIEEKAVPTEEFLTLAREMQQFDMEKDRELIEAKEKENEKLVEARKEQLREVEELLEDEAELDLLKVTKMELPAEITSRQLGMIELMIK
jgi:hypothetical protein